MLERTNFFSRYLRRYSWKTSTGHDCANSYHNALIVIDDKFTVPRWIEEDIEGGDVGIADKSIVTPHNDPRWLKKCDKCDYVFIESDEWQDGTDRLYELPDGTKCTIREAPIGAMYYSDWWPDKGTDGHCLSVILPPDRHAWLIDGPANNCTMRNDRDHDCWCRHGVPPNITVNKTPEPGRRTCNAGGGSIQTPSWHGFLRDGKLVTA